MQRSPEGEVKKEPGFFAAAALNDNRKGEYMRVNLTPSRFPSGKGNWVFEKAGRNPESRE